MTTSLTTTQPTSSEPRGCDRCGARAATRVVLTTGDLLFCGHHTHTYEARLLDAGATFAALTFTVAR